MAATSAKAAAKAEGKWYRKAVKTAGKDHEYGSSIPYLIRAFCEALPKEAEAHMDKLTGQGWAHVKLILEQLDRTTREDIIGRWPHLRVSMRWDISFFKPC